MIQSIISKEQSTTGRFVVSDAQANTVKVLEFTSVPGARSRADGDGSAEQFYEEYVKGKLTSALDGGETLTVDFDGTWGYASSFISELARRIALDFDKVAVKQHLALKSEDEPALIDRFWNEFEKDYTE
jgi:hypothetical protein